MDYPTRFNKLLAGHSELTRLLGNQSTLINKFSPVIFDCLSDEWEEEIELIITAEQELIMLVKSPGRATKLRFLLPTIKKAVATSTGNDMNILIKVAPKQSVEIDRESNNSMRNRSIGSRESSSVVYEAACNLENQELSASLKNLAENLANQPSEDHETHREVPS